MYITKGIREHLPNADKQQTSKLHEQTNMQITKTNAFKIMELKHFDFLTTDRQTNIKSERVPKMKHWHCQL